MTETGEHATLEAEPSEGPVEADAHPAEPTEEELRLRDEALAKVITFGDPVLRSRASEVREFGPELAAEADRMIAIMRDAMGVGLAATQLGALRRMLVFQAGPDATPTAIANPVLEWSSDELATAAEGCLSLPRVIVDVERPLYVRVTGADTTGEPILIEASGLEARVLQHEIDHLDGVLILDRTEREQRKGAMRALREGTELRPGHRRRRRRRERRERRGERGGMSSGPARLAYLGTSDFAATILRRLAAGSSKPALVVTPPDRRRGRGRRLAPPPAAATAVELGLDLHQTADVNAPESLAALDDAGIDLGLVCAFGQFLKPPLLERIELLNVHPSLLPRWRGAAPIERAIMAGDERTGVAIIRVTEELDAGPVALCEEIAIEPGDDYGSLSSELAELGGELAVRALALRAGGELRFTDQDEAAMTYAEKIDSGERALDPRRPAPELERRVRALTPHVGTYLELEGGDRLGVARRAGDRGGSAGGRRASSGPATRSSWAATPAPC